MKQQNFNCGRKKSTAYYCTKQMYTYTAWQLTFGFLNEMELVVDPDCTLPFLCS